MMMASFGSKDKEFEAAIDNQRAKAIGVESFPPRGWREILLEQLLLRDKEQYYDQEYLLKENYYNFKNDGFNYSSLASHWHHLLRRNRRQVFLFGVLLVVCAIIVVSLVSWGVVSVVTSEDTTVCNNVVIDSYDDYLAFGQNCQTINNFRITGKKLGFFPAGESEFILLEFPNLVTITQSLLIANITSDVPYIISMPHLQTASSVSLINCTGIEEFSLPLLNFITGVFTVRSSTVKIIYLNSLETVLSSMTLQNLTLYELHVQSLTMATFLFLHDLYITEIDFPLLANVSTLEILNSKSTGLLDVCNGDICYTAPMADLYPEDVGTLVDDPRLFLNITFPLLYTVEVLIFHENKHINYVSCPSLIRAMRFLITDNIIVDVVKITPYEFNVTYEENMSPLSFPNLRQIKDLTITSNIGLKAIQFESLNVTERVTIVSNPQLKDLNLTLIEFLVTFICDFNIGLTWVDMPKLKKVEEDLRFVSNAKLDKLSFPAINMVTNVILALNTGLAMVDFPAMAVGAVYVFSNPVLTTIDMPVLEKSYTIAVNENPNLQQLLFPKLSAIMYDDITTYTASSAWMLSLSLSNWRSVILDNESPIVIGNNNKLTFIDFTILNTIDGNITIVNNLQLTTIASCYEDEMFTGIDVVVSPPVDYSCSQDDLVFIKSNSTTFATPTTPPTTTMVIPTAT